METRPSSTLHRLAAPIALLAAVSLGSSAHAQVAKLSGPPPFIPTGFTNRTEISPDGEWVVYEASQDVEGWNLYSVPTKGGRSPLQLAGPLDTDFAFVEFGIDPNSVFVVYRALGHLYSVPIADPAGTVVLDQGLEPFVVDARHARVAGSVALDADIVPPGAESVDSLAGGFLIDPTGSWVLFTNGDTLYSVPIDGSHPPIELHARLFEASYRGYVFTPDGSHVVYAADEVDAIVAPALFVVPVDGSAAPRRISQAPIAQRGVASFALDASGETAVFHADQLEDERFELFSVPVDGSAEPVRISAPLAAFSNIGYYVYYTQVEYVIVGSHVVYRCDHDLDQVFEFYSVPIEGGAPPIKLHAPLSGESDVVRGLPVGSERFVYGVHGGTEDELFVTRVDGSSDPIPLDSPELRAHGGISVSPDGQWLVFRRMLGPIGYHSFELYRVALNGRSAPVRLSLPGQYVDFIGSNEPMISSDSEHVVYVSGVIQRVRLDGTEAPIALTPPPVSHGYFHSIAITPDGQRLVYRSEQDRYDVPEIYSVPLDASTQPVKLNGPITLGYVTGNVSHFDFSANGARAIFTFSVGYEDADGGLDQIFGVPLEFGAPRVPIFEPLGTDFGDDDLGDRPQISPDGTYAAFTLGLDESEFYEVFAARADGTAPPVQLSDNYTWGAEGHQFSPDGTRVVFVQRSFSDDHIIRSLFSAPSDGSSPSVRLSQVTSARGVDPGSIRVTPDGSRVIYAANLALPGAEFELFSVPIDGSAQPVAFNDLEFPRGNLPERYDAQFSEDGTRVVYVMDQNADEVYELFSAPVDGSAQPTKLSGTFAANRDVLAGIRIAGSRAVYVSDLEVNERYELFVVPVDGSAPPLKVSGSLVLGGDVRTLFEVAPCGTRVVYVADADSDEKYELYVAPLDGSASPLKLSGAIIPGGDVEFPFYPTLMPFAISADGARVVYAANQDQLDVIELFSVPIDRSAEPVQISGELVPGGDVQPNFRITPDGREVLYVADQTQDEVYELFRSRIGLPGTALRVNSPLTRDGDVAPVPFFQTLDWTRPVFEITPDSQHVVYAADQELDGVRELYMAVLAPRRPGLTAPAGKASVRVR